MEDISRIADDAYRDPTDNVNGSSNIQNNNVSQYNQTQPTTVSQQETNAQHTQSSEDRSRMTRPCQSNLTTHL